jgi:uncharacterized protein YbaA (DUF1428 family)
MKYVDGFVLTVPKKNLAAYEKIAREAGKVWIACGALDYVECVGEDMKVPMGIPFPDRLEPKRGEVVLFSYITYKSKKHRDQVNKKVMANPRMLEMCGKKMPFDCNRMSYGGFEVLVRAGKK